MSILSFQGLPYREYRSYIGNPCLTIEIDIHKLSEAVKIRLTNFKKVTSYYILNKPLFLMDFHERKFTIREHMEKRITIDHNGIMLDNFIRMLQCKLNEEIKYKPELLFHTRHPSIPAWYTASPDTYEDNIECIIKLLCYYFSKGIMKYNSFYLNIDLGNYDKHYIIKYQEPITYSRIRLRDWD